MKIQIDEVGIGNGYEKKTLVVIESENPKWDVYKWISINRPDLDIATLLEPHGFHAFQI
jgi:hypothetical protein